MTVATASRAYCSYQILRPGNVMRSCEAPTTRLPRTAHPSWLRAAYRDGVASKRWLRSQGGTWRSAITGLGNMMSGTSPIHRLRHGDSQRANWNTAAATMVPRMVPAMAWLRVWSRSSTRDQPTARTRRKPRVIQAP